MAASIRKVKKFWAFAGICMYIMTNLDIKRNVLGTGLYREMLR
jgi:hypothetical protein